MPGAQSSSWAWLAAARPPWDGCLPIVSASPTPRPTPSIPPPTWQRWPMVSRSPTRTGSPGWRPSRNRSEATACWSSPAPRSNASIVTCSAQRILEPGSSTWSSTSPLRSFASPPAPATSCPLPWSPPSSQPWNRCTPSPAWPSTPPACPRRSSPPPWKRWCLRIRRRRRLVYPDGPATKALRVLASRPGIHA